MLFNGGGASGGTLKERIREVARRLLTRRPYSKSSPFYARAATVRIRVPRAGKDEEG